MFLSFSICHSLTLFITLQLAHSFRFSRFIKESINLSLPVSHGNLTFIPKYYDQSNPKPHYGPAQLIHDGNITNSDLRYRGLISFRGNGSNKEVIIVSLKSSHSGIYEIRDRSGNLVSSTVLQVDGESQDALKCS